MEPILSTELAITAFDADAALSAALAEFQKAPRDQSVLDDAARAAAHGFAWFARPSEAGHFQVVLRHKGGAEISADGESIVTTLAGLLGHPLAHDVAVVFAQASESEQEAIAPGLEPRAKASPAQMAKTLDHARGDALSERAAAESVATVTAGPGVTAPPSPAQLAAESLAAATGGVVVAEVVADPEPDPTQPLTDEQKAVCVEMIKALTADQRKNFTVSFRDAFRVPREASAIAPLIAEVRHMEFCDRWSIEAAGGVAP